jgi:pimeloyl-ACP methyl ester carboxylesterase
MAPYLAREVGYSRLVERGGGKLRVGPCPSAATALVRGALACTAAALAAAALAVAALVAFPPRALSAPACAGGAPGFECMTVTVPLDRSGGAPGTIALHVARRRAAGAPSRDAVVALAGGPGQAALPLSGLLAQTIAPALGARDLVVFDQRGTGLSDPLRCKAIEGPVGSTLAAAQRALGRCAGEEGPARGAFTSVESVADIEAIREALHYEKLVLYGTSYGTKVALEYAAEHPAQVEALVLDSVVPPDGPAPFEQPTFAALSPVLHELCSHGACRTITARPVANLARLARRLRSHALNGHVYDGYGRRHALAVRAPELLEILIAGDLNPALRALFPAALVAALRGDDAPMTQLYALAQGLVPSVPRTSRRRAQAGVNEALFWTTTCEEEPFPWQRTAPPARRHAEALAALDALPASVFFPFERTVGLTVGPTLGCLDWPDASQAPPTSWPEPDVPTLILSGGQDLRTPTAQARAVAGQIPGAQLVVVPYTGHSVLTSDLSGCAEAAVQSFFAGLRASGCGETKDVFAPTPIPPVALSRVRPTPGISGTRGRTVTAVLDTVIDLDRLVIAATLQAEQNLPSGSRFGGLRGGYAVMTNSAVRLAGFSFVPGVALTGTLPVVNGRLQPRPLRIEGRAAAHGTVQLGGRGEVTGTLGGRRFDVRIARAVLSRAGAQGGAAQVDAAQGGASTEGWPADPLDLRPAAPRTGLRHIP